MLELAFRVYFDNSVDAVSTGQWSQRVGAVVEAALEDVGMAPEWYASLPPNAGKLLAAEGLFEALARVALAALGAAGGMERLDRMLTMMRRKYRHVKLASSKVLGFLP